MEIIPDNKVMPFYTELVKYMRTIVGIINQQHYDVRSRLLLEVERRNKINQNIDEELDKHIKDFEGLDTYISKIIESFTDKREQNRENLLKLYYIYQNRKTMDSRNIYVNKIKMIKCLKEIIEQSYLCFKRDIETHGGETNKTKLKYFQDNYLKQIKCDKYTIDLLILTGATKAHTLNKTFMRSIIPGGDFENGIKQESYEREIWTSIFLYSISAWFYDKQSFPIENYIEPDYKLDNTKENFENCKKQRNENEEQQSNLNHELDNNEIHTNFEGLFEYNEKKKICDKKPTHEPYFIKKNEIIEKMNKSNDWHKSFFLILINEITTFEGTRAEMQTIYNDTPKWNHEIYDSNFSERLQNFISNLKKIVGECTPTEEYVADNGQPTTIELSDNREDMGISVIGGRKTKRKTMKKRRKTRRKTMKKRRTRKTMKKTH
jgi:hypothetical protein